ncbi:MAG: right-handed parallel beta-helix repeat-containing protein, partial [Planctomycetota bacterium]
MRVLVAFLTILAGVAVCQGRIIRVDDDGPADFNNIQAAIDDANDGDTVEIQAGRYTGPGNRDIDFKGKAITVCSANGPGDCIIDCNGTEADPHRGFIFQNSEGPTSVLSGLTIINGYSGSGGAIYCRLSSPTIAHCIIAGNRASSRGGGLRFGSGWGMSPAFLINCTIAGNSAGRLGGGIYAIGKADVTIINSIVRGNSTPYTQDNEIGIEIRIDAHNPRFTVSYSNIKDGLDGIKYSDLVEWGAGNIDGDPCFADAENHDYHLKSQGGRWD